MRIVLGPITDASSAASLHNKLFSSGRSQAGKIKGGEAAPHANRLAYVSSVLLRLSLVQRTTWVVIEVPVLEL